MYVPYENNTTLMSIDPASGSLGLTISEYDLESMQLHLVEVCTINADKLLTADIQDQYSNIAPNIIKLHLISNILEEKIREYDPHVLIHEATFCSPKYITAFRSLTRFEMMIQSLCLKMPFRIPVKVIEATKVKKCVGAKGGDKNLVKCGIMHLINCGVIIPHNININYLDDHAIDSIAIGYTYTIELSNKIKDGYYLWE